MVLEVGGCHYFGAYFTFVHAQIRAGDGNYVDRSILTVPTHFAGQKLQGNPLYVSLRSDIMTGINWKMLRMHHGTVLHLTAMFFL